MRRSPVRSELPAWQQLKQSGKFLKSFPSAQHHDWSMWQEIGRAPPAWPKQHAGGPTRRHLGGAVRHGQPAGGLGGGLNAPTCSREPGSERSLRSDLPCAQTGAPCSSEGASAKGDGARNSVLVLVLVLALGGSSRGRERWRRLEEEALLAAQQWLVPG
ncbi:unnamed protein product [Lampetra planeri]